MKRSSPPCRSLGMSCGRYFLLPHALAMLFTLGCGGDSSEPSVEELIRRRKQLESVNVDRSGTAIDKQVVELEQKLIDGNLGGVNVDLKPLLISHPNHPGLMLMHARLLAAQGRIADAIEIADSIVPVDDDLLAKSLGLVSEWALQTGRYDLAREQLNRLLVVQGPSNRLHRQLANVLNNMGLRIEAAVHLGSLADKGDISEKELFAMNTYSDPFIDTSMPSMPLVGEPQLGWLAHARRYHSDGDLRRAREWIDRLAKYFPQSPAISAFRGRVYNDLADDFELINWVRALPAGIEEQPEYWSAIGNWAARNGMHDNAIRCFCEAVSRDATDRFSYLALARSLRAVGQMEAARIATERFEILDDIAQLIQEIGKAPASSDELNRMAAQLDSIGRSAEAVAWRRIAQRSPQNSRSSRNLLASKDTDFIDSIAAPSQDVRLTPQSPQFITCGVDRLAWPLPTFEQFYAPNSKASAIAMADELSGQIQMVDIAAKLDVDFAYDNGDDPADDARLLHQMTGGGIGVVDYDLDGWPDLYFSQAGGQAYDEGGSKPNRMYRNLAGERFIDATEFSSVGDLGYGQGIAVADINQDGFPDLLVANIGPNLLYINNGDGTFNRMSLPHAGDGGWTTSIACGDLDGDGLPEIVEVNYVDDPLALTVACTPERDVCNPSAFRPALDRILRTNRSGGLEEWSHYSRLASKPNYGFAAVIANIDGKDGNDLFIANDTDYNHLWVSSGQAERDSPSDAGIYRLSEMATILGCAAGGLGQRQGCMGIATGDFDRNGFIDLHVTNYWNQPADLYLQQPTGEFINGNLSHGVHDASLKTVGWGTQAVDLDRDGWLDLVVLNGHLTDHRRRGVPLEMKPQLFRGSGTGFALVANSLPPATPSVARGDDRFWDKPALGRTLAILDWNDDGKPDLVANSLDGPVSLLENKTETKGFVKLELVGVSSERDAIGAKVVLSSGESSWFAWVVGGGGFLSANQRVIDVGIGDEKVVDRIEVVWPSGIVQRFENLPINQSLLIIEGDSVIHPRQFKTNVASTADRPQSPASVD